jgi:hypothetical protein
MNQTKKPSTRKLPDLTDEQQEIVRRLNSINASERIPAEQALLKMGAEAIPVIQHVLASPVEVVRWENRITLLLWIGGTIFLPLIAWRLGYIPPSAILPGLLMSFFVVSFIGIFARMIWIHSISLRAFHPAQEAVLRALAAMNNVQVIGFLAETAHRLRAEYGIKGAASLRPALIRLLPRLNRSVYITLTEHQKNCLYFFLRDYSAFMLSHGTDSDPPMGVPRTELDVPMTVALLQLYGRVGDNRAISYIERLVYLSPTINTKEEWEVHEAALACLAGLKEHAAEWKSVTTHLRASTASETPQAELLLPAASVTQADVEELLRPSDQEDKH